VYEPVELLAKNRKGETVPYFKSGSQRWTDGGLQEDLPQRRLSELFNVNQFIVSQVADLSASSACPLPILLLAAS
jgi:predicted acylesterase/phospholipase RssA